jgi:hypothetical protein
MLSAFIVRAAADGGSVRLSFNGVVSRRIQFDADEEELYIALTALASLQAIDVEMDGSGQLCTGDGGSFTIITIVHPQVLLVPARWFAPPLLVFCLHCGCTKAFPLVHRGLSDA